MEKFKNKYRIPSTRLPGWDYSRGGKYYVTIITRKRVCFFGDVVNGEMQLNERGRIANHFWLEIQKHFSYTWLDEFIVMPNHIHGIVVMKRSHLNKQNNESGHDGCARHMPKSHIPVHPNIFAAQYNRIFHRNQDHYLRSLVLSNPPAPKNLIKWIMAVGLNGNRVSMTKSSGTVTVCNKFAHTFATTQKIGNNDEHYN